MVLLTDGAGAVTDTWEYEAFGTVVARTGTTSNAILYSGEWMDDAQGLQYLRARWYAPGMGRFVSADTWETPDGSFRYVGNEPLTRIDPSGHATLQEIEVTIFVNAQLAIQAHPVLTAAAGAIMLGALPAEFNDALTGVQLPGFAALGELAKTEASAIRLLKSKVGWRIQREVEKASGYAAQKLTGSFSYALGKQFEQFVWKYVIPGAERLPDKAGIGDYVWREMYVECKSGKGVELDQFANIAAHAAKENTGFMYIYLVKPSKSAIKTITEAGGAVYYLFEE